MVQFFFYLPFDSWPRVNMDPLLQPVRKRTRATVHTDHDTQAPEKKKPILQFVGSGFRYNTRVAIAVLPTLLGLLVFGGSPLVKTIHTKLKLTS